MSKAKYNQHCSLISLLSFFILFASPAFSTQKTEDPSDIRLVYSVTGESWSPYWIVSAQNIGGILHDVLQEINQRATFRLEPSTIMPVKRARIAFANGDITVECCVNKAWRSSGLDSKSNAWTDVVMTVEEVLIFPKGHDFKIHHLSDLKGKVIATISGYGYVGDEFFARSDSPNKVAQLTKVAAKRVDAAIIDKRVFQFSAANNETFAQLLDKVEVGPIINESELRIRVHKKHTSLIPEFNRVISNIKSDGTLSRLMAPYSLAK